MLAPTFGLKNTFMVAALKNFMGALVRWKMSFSSLAGFMRIREAVIFQMVSWNSLVATASSSILGVARLRLHKGFLC